MDELRWILLAIGTALIAGVYLWGVRGSLVDKFRKPDHGLTEHHPDALVEDGELDPLQRREPSIGGLPESEPDDAVGEADESEIVADVTAGNAQEDVDEDSERLNIVLTLIGVEERQFTGAQIGRAAADLGLRKGREGTLDCYADDSFQGTPVFSVANVLEPGIFDWSEMDSLRTPGLVCFMRLPGAVDGQSALEMLLGVTQGLCERLNATLCDDRRMRLSPQGIEHLRSEVTEFERRRRLEALRRRHG